MSEHQEQATFFEWVRLERERAPSEQVRKALKLCYAVPNGASMKDSQRLRMLREGMEKGILDINLDMPVTVIEVEKKAYEIRKDRALRECDREHVFYDIVHPVHKKVKNMFAGLRIEMKFGKNKLSKEQKEKMALLEEAAFKVVVCYSAVEAIRAVFKYLSFEANDYAAIRNFL